MASTASLSAGNNQGFQLGVNNGTIRDLIINNNNADDSCLEQLRLTNPRHDKERIKDTKGGLLEGSYKWILKHPDFQRWRDDDQSQLLWIKGDPGKGKTMLLIGIIDELERQPARLKQAKQSTSHATVLSYFFCQGTDSKLNNATAVLRGLIFLLAVQQPSLASHLRNEYEHSGAKLFEDGNAFFALSDILSGMLRDPSLTRAYMIIDALDECETGLQQLLKFVVQNTSASRVKWVVSSRNRHDIERHLKLDDSQMLLSLELKANAEHVSHAVGLYIDDRVAQLESLQDDDALRKKAADILRQKADGTFLWVALVVQELKTVESWDVLDVLEEVPTGLDELYARMMNQIQKLKRGDPVYCRLVLSAATLAYRPLHILELRVLSGLPEKISSNAQRVQTIIKMCGSFLTVRNDQVYIIHQSAKDYLSDKATTTIFPSGRAEVHRSIFQRLLHSMLNSLRRDIYALGHPGFSIDSLKIPDPDPLAYVRYSCIHWVDHLCEAQHRDFLIDGGPVHDFLEGYLLYWIEASSLCRAMSDVVFAVVKLEMLLKTISSESGLLSLTLDAHRFLLHNGWVIKNAPLQTYISALLFTPTRSLTRELFEREKPQWVLTGPTVEECWSPLVRTLEGHGSWVNAVAFSPDGKLIASASDDKTIKVWDAATGEVQRTLEGHSDWVHAVAFSPDGKLIASASNDETVKVWDAATGEVQRTLKGHSDWVHAVAFSPDGKLIASASDDKTIKVWDAATGEVQRTLKGHGGWVRAVAFSPDGKLIASASNDKTIKVWDAATGEVQRTLEGHGSSVNAVAFSTDGKLIASVSDDETIQVWDAATGEVQRTLEGHGGWVHAVAFSPDRKLIVSASNDETIKVWDAATGEVQRTLEGHSDWVHAVAFSTDGKLIASASNDETIKVWDAATGEVQRTLEGHGSSVNAMAFSADGKLIVSASDDKTIKVWDAATGEVQRTLEGHGSSVNAVAFSTDGKLIASASNDETIKVWDAATGEVQRTLEGHGGWVHKVAVSSPDSATGLRAYRHTISFDPTGLYLFTDTGSIKMDTVAYINPIGLIQSQFQSQSQSQEAEQCGYGLSPDKSWITWNGHKALWLPPEYLPSVSAIWRSAAPSPVVARVAIGCGSGRFIVISFSGPPPGLPSS